MDLDLDLDLDLRMVDLDLHLDLAVAGLVTSLVQGHPEKVCIVILSSNKFCRNSGNQQLIIFFVIVKFIFIMEGHQKL